MDENGRMTEMIALQYNLQSKEIPLNERMLSSNKPGP